MVGGDADLLEQCRPLLETMGKTIPHVGAVGQGKVVKIVNQVLAATHLLAMGEALALGVKCGADPKVIYEVLKTSSGYSKMMDLRLPGFLFKGAFQPGFKLDLMKKDLNLAVDSAQATGDPVGLRQPGGAGLRGGQHGRPRRTRFLGCRRFPGRPCGRQTRRRDVKEHRMSEQPNYITPELITKRYRPLTARATDSQRCCSRHMRMAHVPSGVSWRIYIQ